MDHPLIDNLTDLTDEQLTDKSVKLTKKFFQTRNPQAQRQIQIVLDSIKLEQRDRMEKKRLNNPNKDLDNLINID
jgi:hypothetical protein|tara:strand:- start:1832 stop:2056 length:225 start_codon:yes stop_codon:yes gene_type:complete